MNKPVLGIIVGGVLGIFDGLSALLSAPQTAPEIGGIVVGSTIKGVIAGVLIGVFARKVRSLPLGVVFGLGVGLLLALPIAILNHYYWQILLPGGLVGLIVGYATQRYGRPPAAGAGAAAASP
jgi:hypothetical protein